MVSMSLLSLNYTIKAKYVQSSLPSSVILDVSPQSLPLLTHSLSPDPNTHASTLSASLHPHILLPLWDPSLGAVSKAFSGCSDSVVHSPRCYQSSYQSGSVARLREQWSCHSSVKPPLGPYYLQEMNMHLNRQYQIIFGTSSGQRI